MAMEARDIDAQPQRARPRLTVVDAPKFSALPHDILFDKGLSQGAIVLYAVLQSHWWQKGECFASNATLAADLRCSDSQLRRYLGELVRGGRITSRRSGRGQAKAYAPTKSTVNGDGQQFTGEQLNRSSVSGLDANRSPMEAQPFTGDNPNRSPVTVPYKKTPVKKTLEEDSHPTGEARTAKKPKATTPKKTFTPCPEDFAPSEAMVSAAMAKHGVTRQWLDEQTARFVDYWTNTEKGSRVKRDGWGLSWVNWINRDAPKANSTNGRYEKKDQYRNGLMPGAASKQTSKWSEHATNYSNPSAEASKGRP